MDKDCFGDSVFWGKLELDADRGLVAWHPLVDHCIDVACCMEALLRQPNLAGRLARLGGLHALDPVTRDRLSVLAGLHDLGKFNHGFQDRAPGRRGEEACGHVEPALSLVANVQRHPIAQHLVGALHLAQLSCWGPALEFLLPASLAHHGRPCPLGGTLAEGRWRANGARDPFKGIGDLTSSLLAAFPRALEPQGPELPASPEFGHAFAGLVMLADWLGSDTQAFMYSAEGDDRVSFARRAASKLLVDVGLDASGARTRVSPSRPTCAELVATLGKGFKPRPLQEATHGLEPPGAEGSLAVLEAATGSGKTEAAVLHFVELFRAGRVDGMVFAVPTRAAATQLHGRICRMVHAVFGEAAPAVLLAVPGYLKVDDVEGRLLAPFQVLWDDANSRDRWRYWAAENSKRYLAGAIAIGTIDQVLMSALMVPHAHLRASCLLRHLLVVDEVHASDAYMAEILQTVLKNHFAAGGHALLMSATLGSSAREKLVRIGLPGRPPLPRLEEATAVPYPVLTWRRGNDVTQIPVVGLERSKEVEIEQRRLAEDPAGVAALALDAAAREARVLVIRNRVQDCVATQRELERLAARRGLEGALFSVDGVRAPHHGRFAALDRKVLDTHLEQAFSVQRPLIVVATQTVEQSLDIDADLLLTDLCPIDVLLQRIGRLHRHERERPAGFGAPRCVVLTPTDRDLGSLLSADGDVRGSAPAGLGRVYPDLRVLEATWRRVERDSTWTIPRQNRTLVEGCLNPEVLAAIESEGGETWRQHGYACTGIRLAESRLGERVTVDRSKPYCRQVFPEVKIATRLGEGDRMVPLDPPATSPLGQLVRELSVPEWMARELGPEPVGKATPDRDGLRVDVGGVVLRYGRMGLEENP